MVKEEGEYKSCLFCELMCNLRVEIRKNSVAISNLSERVQRCETDAGMVSAKAVFVEEVEAEVLGKVDNLETRMVKVETRLEDRDGFQPVRRGSKVKVSTSNSSVSVNNRFQVLEDQVQDDPSIILLGDSLIRHQEEEFCTKGPRRKRFCFPGCKIQDVTEKVDDLVINTSEDSVYVTVVGTNNIASGRSEEILRKYRDLIRKFKDSRRKLVICGLLPRFDVGPVILSRMIGVNVRLEGLCRKEGVMFVDVWDHFSQDRSLYGRGGLHLNRVGKARLGRVLDENVRHVLDRNREVDKGSGNGIAIISPTPEASNVGEVRSGANPTPEVRLSQVREVGSNQVGEVRSELQVRSVAVSTDDLNN